MSNLARIPGEIGPIDVEMGVPFIVANTHNLRPVPNTAVGDGYTQGYFATSPVVDMNGNRHVLINGGPPGITGFNNFEWLFSDARAVILIELTQPGIKRFYDHAYAVGNLFVADLLASDYPEWCPTEPLELAHTQLELNQVIDQINELETARKNASRQITELTARKDALRDKLNSSPIDS